MTSVAMPWKTLSPISASPHSARSLSVWKQQSLGSGCFGRTFESCQISASWPAKQGIHRSGSDPVLLIFSIRPKIATMPWDLPIDNNKHTLRTGRGTNHDFAQEAARHVKNALTHCQVFLPIAIEKNAHIFPKILQRASNIQMNGEWFW